MKHLTEKFVEVLEQVVMAGFEVPMVLVAVGSNGSMLAVEYDVHPEGHLDGKPIAERVKDGELSLPINIVIVDARGEAGRVVLKSSGRSKVVPFDKKWKH